jgi:hypothetical protein
MRLENNSLRKRVINRSKKTKLHLLEGGRWVVGNTSSAMELVVGGLRTAGGSISARNAAVDITNAVEDYTCSDYPCLILDTTATACDITGALCAAIPGSPTQVFVVVTSTSHFCRTLRNLCKSKNIFGCK